VVGDRQHVVIMFHVSHIYLFLQMFFLFATTVRYCQYGNALIRVSHRDDSPKVRAMLTWMSCCNVISIHGSLRTARLGAIRYWHAKLRRRHRMDRRNSTSSSSTTTPLEAKPTPTTQELLRQMDEAVQAILDIAN
jgi:hypothetical protein